MAVYDLEEQEQLAEMKAWWKQHGNLVTGLVVAGLFLLALFFSPVIAKVAAPSATATGRASADSSGADADFFSEKEVFMGYLFWRNKERLLFPIGETTWAIRAKAAWESSG